MVYGDPVWVLHLALQANIEPRNGALRIENYFANCCLGFLANSEGERLDTSIPDRTLWIGKFQTLTPLHFEADGRSVWAAFGESVLEGSSFSVFGRLNDEPSEEGYLRQPMLLIAPNCPWNRSVRAELCLCLAHGCLVDVLLSVPSQG